ncbi:phytanoyl-CoA dioxygenase family protein [Pedobacter ureilyticus]|uniref:Phytanoyl-CoA dioxygenase family protein n=1 Tax=Pedobacter ureilyticus TaxID=1393051 RepID=A0ABW9J584_9SPHI|nr:phytanoyl-CoA dioxygenase family protein [Pedobacter helvus]
MNNAPNDFQFLSIYRSKRNPQNLNSKDEPDFLAAESYFLNTFEIGLFEVYNFLYQDCKSDTHFEDWLINLKGVGFYQEKKNLFNKWYQGKQALANEKYERQFLSEDQIHFWETNGYLQLGEFIAKDDCDEVVALICETLSIDLTDSKTWYPKHDLLQGLMLQLYQGAAIEKIRKNSRLFDAFADLYETKQLIANSEKVSYNPPETKSFHFMGSPLHWDIDFGKGPRYYIQGLVYLNDVPADRGAFCLVPGFHKKIDAVLENENPEVAITKILETEKVAYLGGKKGDVILWLEALPHAASPNHSNLPRFVQYVSFLKV